MSKINPFINNITGKKKKIPLEKDDWKKFEKNNVTVALNVLYAKKEETYSAYVSKHNSNCGREVILFMIPNGEEWH